MLFKVVIVCIAAAVGSKPLRLEPQFEADDEEELRDEKLPAWLESTGYTQVEGTDLEVSEVVPDGVPEPEPEKGEAPSTEPDAKGPVAPDGVQLPTLDEYVAAGYLAENYETFIERRMKPVSSAGSTPVDPNDLAKSAEPKTELVIGESTNDDGAIYMGHDAHGVEVWDLPERTSDAPLSEDGEEETKS